MEDLAVEVYGENKAYYKAFITDVHEDGVTVAFENDWQPESKFPYHRVRLPPKALEDDKPISIADDQEVEVFSRGNEGEVCGWWRALVKTSKGHFHAIEHLGHEVKYSEIVSSDRLRLKNTNQSITRSTFHVFEIPVPEHVQEYSKEESVHKEFKKAIGAAICKYNVENKCLKMILFSSQGRHDVFEKRAGMLSNMHFKNLRQKVLLRTRLQEAACLLETQEAVKKSRIMLEARVSNAKESVQVPRRLVDTSTQTEGDEVATGEDKPSEKPGVEELQKCLHELLVGGEDTDVRINVQGKEFSVHRAILRARSPVFQAMFTHDMVEKQSGVVTMEDSDPESFPDFLEHIYTGSTEMISAGNVFSLFTAADKYNLSILKDACTTFIKNHLNVSCFCDAITIAVKHNEKELIECATEFFSLNMSEILETVEWQIFLKENTTVGNELLIKGVRKLSEHSLLKNN